MDEMFTNHLSRSRFPGGLAGWLVLAALLGMTACARAPAGRGINDPDEAANRAAHRFNVKLDRTLFGDGKQKGVVPTIPGPIAVGAGNFASNLGLPSMVVNDLCLLYTSPSPRDRTRSRMPSSA